MSDQSDYDFVKGRYPGAVCAFRELVSEYAQLAPFIPSAWQVFTTPEADCECLGQGATELDAWHEAAMKIRKRENKSG